MRIDRHPKLPYLDPFARSKEIRASDVVKSARLWADLTQTEVARRSGLDQRTISAWERGRQEPAFASVLTVLGACELDIIVTPVARHEPLGLPGRIVVTGARTVARSLSDGLARNRRLRRSQLRQYARERP